MTVEALTRLRLSADERALCGRLAGQPQPLTPGLIEAARAHRMHLLLADSLTPTERATGEGAALLRELRGAAALDASRESAIRDALERLSASGLDVLVLKGTAVAYSLYSAPHLRPRADIDVLLRRASVAASEDVLAAAGWTRPAERDAQVSAAQRHYVKPGPAGSLHHLDLHWRIANPRVFADAVTFDELLQRAVTAERLAPSARRVSSVDALLLACIHRVAHHGDEIDLLWLYDIYLLMESLSDEERAFFVDLARRTRMCGVCRRGVDLASESFGPTATAVTTARLLHQSEDAPEPSAQFIGGASWITVWRTDLATLHWRSRVALAREHVLPSLAYMRTRYPGWPDALLPLAYVYRIVRGAPGWFKRAQT